MDLTQGYHQAPLTFATRAYTAFITFSGVYQFTRLPFGPKRACSFGCVCIPERHTSKGNEDINMLRKSTKLFSRNKFDISIAKNSAIIYVHFTNHINQASKSGHDFLEIRWSPVWSKGQSCELIYPRKGNECSVCSCCEG